MSSTSLTRLPSFSTTSGCLVSRRRVCLASSTEYSLAGRASISRITSPRDSPISAEGELGWTLTILRPWGSSTYFMPTRKRLARSSLSTALERASGRSILLSSTSWASTSLSRALPAALLACITLVTCTVLCSRIRLAAAMLTTSTSRAATRPPPIFLHSVCETTPRSTSESTLRTWACSPASNWSMMRSTEEMAVLVCSVAKTRWPVLAVSSASATVSGSRISPTSTMSGSSRSTALRARAKLLVWPPISRWLTRHCWLGCTNSIGSSSVMMCCFRVRLM